MDETRATGTDEKVSINSKSWGECELKNDESIDDGESDEAGDKDEDKDEDEEDDD